jgi:hypothetical protein
MQSYRFCIVLELGRNAELKIKNTDLTMKYRERESCLLVLNLVSSTPPCIRQPGPRVSNIKYTDLTMKYKHLNAEYTHKIYRVKYSALSLSSDIMQSRNTLGTH